MRIIIASILCLVLTLPVLATPTGKTLGAGKNALDVSIMSLNGTSALWPLIYTRGISDQSEVKMGLADMGVLFETYDIYVSYKRQLMKKADSGFDLAINIPLMTYTLSNNVGVASAALQFIASNDWDIFSPYISSGISVLSSNVSSYIVVPINAGVLFSPTKNFDVYGGIGTSFGSTVSVPFNYDFGVEWKF
ncbi:MAG: hypothetical protein KKH83_03350 [Candidatus Margulisbacteria bacterium]|nr:hypothetical protein [Candidatus Margulisiibacteriota bacterium]